MFSDSCVLLSSLIREYEDTTRKNGCMTNMARSKPEMRDSIRNVYFTVSNHTYEENFMPSKVGIIPSKSNFSSFLIFLVALNTAVSPVKAGSKIGKNYRKSF